METWNYFFKVSQTGCVFKKIWKEKSLYASAWVWDDHIQGVIQIQKHFVASLMGHSSRSYSARDPRNKIDLKDT